MTDLATTADRMAPHTPLARALRYLRTQSKRGYCLDKRVPKLPRKSVTTVLDKWMQTR